MSIERLSKIRDEILSLVFEAEEILRKDFPCDHEIAYSFWIPQIVTAIKEAPDGFQEATIALTKPS